MEILVLSVLAAIVGLLNLLHDAFGWLSSPYGLLSGAFVGNVFLCAFTKFCPPSAAVRRLCASAGCIFE